MTTESAADITGAEPAPARATERGFRAIEVLQETCRSAGWDGEYRQLEAGQLEASASMRQLGSVSVTREWASRSLEIALSSPEHALTALVSMSRHKTKINGQGLCANRAILIAPGTEIHTISRAGAVILTITIDNDVFGSCAYNMLQKSPLGGNEKIRMVDCGSEIPRLRHLSECSIRVAEDAPIESDLETLVIESIVQAVRSAEEASPQKDRYHRIARSKMVKRLADYIDENLEERITLSDLCEVGRVSQSTLQRLCRREFGLSPYEYVQVRRLDAARRQLHGREPNMCITEIARHSGFSHLGRFAAMYRRQFGTLPSGSLSSMRRK